MKKFLILISIFMFLTPSAFSNVVRVDSNGYYVDGRGQVPEYARIAPPNDHYVAPKPTRTVVPFNSYYDRNKVGVRREAGMVPVVPNYNRYYSNRRVKPYTKQDYIDVWCTGDKNLNKVDCSTEKYAITFVRARDWAYGAIKAPIKARGPKEAALFLMVDDIALDSPHMHDAKAWSELYNIPVYFGTIDALIPSSWVI